MSGARDEAAVRVDTHVKVLDEDVVRQAKARGIDVLVYAPHFERLPDIRARAERFSDDDLLVVPARELFTGDWKRRKHVLALGLSEPVPDFLTLQGAMEELKRQGAVVLAPHPEFLSVSLDIGDIRQYRKLIDGVEVYNPKHWWTHNERAREIASETGLPAFGSSYAHLPRTIGEVWTAFEDPIPDESALLDALQSGSPRRVFHRDGVGHAFSCKLEFAHLGWENTWKKFDRLYLQGTEPTHPSHIAYDGRFEDVRVY
ncbi:PHP domain-containing protein [Halorientalis salina]|uniref:PHP domain-containing protein n=1 Tax=Halorientalis salina TaxID=2932266 RepID=UPI0010AB5FC5|nr:PHP-associated domain-containing protein [Halorientalis salina]